MLTKKERRIIKDSIKRDKNDMQGLKTLQYKSINFGVSVCISAWKTGEYIEECLDSVAGQTWFKSNDNWEILLGIDGCEDTLMKVKEIMHKYKNLRVFMMNENVGTYITCNTIISLAKYDWIIRFDSDDVMPSDMLKGIMSKDLNLYGGIRYEFHNFGGQKGVGIAWGSHMVRKEVFEKYGGYRDWRIAADYDFLYRIEEDVKILKVRDVHYNRRVRRNSLEFSRDTDMKSKKRAEFHNFIHTKTRKNKVIKKVTTQFKEITV